MKKLMMMAAMAAAGMVGAATISDLSARQRYPWNGKVDIGFTVSGVAAEDGSPVLRVKCIDREQGKTYIASKVTGDTAFANGRHSVVWDMNGEGYSFVLTNALFAVSYENLPPPPYCAIDLSSGASSLSYPVSYLYEVPSGGWTDEYKTTKLVLRRIEPGTLTMGDQVHGGSTYTNITISKQFWIGVFQVTQKQYQLVTGKTPSDHSGDMRPVEWVSWDAITGNDGFIARITARANLTASLPTEAQWEYACRAGTTTDYNNGTNYSSSSQDGNMAVVGRYGYDNGYKGGIVDGKGGYNWYHTTVGSYVPNAWGLYDMHGNVWEWCADWYGSLSSNVTDPTGPALGSYRVLRGGGWFDYAYFCASSFRSNGNPSGGSSGSGFRLACFAESSDK